MAKVDASKIDIEELRKREQIKAILDQMVERTEQLEVNSTMSNELRSYIDTASFIPKHIEAADRRSVSAAQEALQQLQSRVDRVLAIQAAIFSMKKTLKKLETLIVKDLAAAGLVTSKTSGAAAKQLVGIVCSELAIAQDRWTTFEKFCLAVQNHLGDAKDTVRQQIRLDENANWNRRYSGMGS
jgi:hypothetical protein